MERSDMAKIILKVRGREYEATIEGIHAHVADTRSPWEKDDVLQVWLSFERGEGKYPGSILGFGVTLPVKDYKPGELLKLIKVEAEREVEKSLIKSDQDHAYYKAKDERQKELDEVASRLSESLQKGVGDGAAV